MGSPYGYRISPIGVNKGKRAFHNGQDFAAPTGTAVYAIAPGLVSKRYDMHAVNGNAIILAHPHPTITGSSYVHLSEVFVKTGDRVSRGQLIGRVGSTGNSTGPHLHFVLYKRFQHTDPMPYLLAASTDAEALTVPSSDGAVQAEGSRTSNPVMEGALAFARRVPLWGWLGGGLAVSVLLILGVALVRRRRARRRVSQRAQEQRPLTEQDQASEAA